MSGPTTFKVTEILGPLGWIEKLPFDYREFYLDFSRWLASDETIVSVSSYAVVANPDVPDKCWSLTYGCPPPCGACGSSGAGSGGSEQPAYSLDGSTILEIGGTPQTLFTGLVPPRGFELANPNPDYLDDIWVSDVGPAEVNGAGSWRVAGNGGTYTTPEDYQPIGPVSAVGVRDMMYLTARMWGGGVGNSGPLAPVDTTPLQVIMAGLSSGGRRASISVAGGTAGFTYGLSILAVAQPTYRRKAVDILCCVGTPMVEVQVPIAPPPGPFVYVTGSINLPVGTKGDVFVQNSTGGFITIGLPPLPNVNDELSIKDILGNAHTYNIIVQSVDSTNIDNQDFWVINFDYGALRIKWTGDKWSVL